MGSLNSFLVLVFFALIGATLPIKAKELEEQKFEFDIHAQKVSTALDELSEQSGALAMFPFDLAESKTSNPVKGVYTIEEALSIMLQGTGFIGGLSDNHVISFKPIISTSEHREKTRMKRITKAGFLAAVAAGAPIADASAQDTQTNASDDLVEVISVTGVRQSVAKGIELKRDSNGFVDAIVAEDIGDFPDLNVTEALQRIPGVSVFRDRGEGRFITVRSLAPQFTQVRVNGQVLTSPGGRNVDLDTFASELFQNITIKKTPSASTTEGGLAATVDMQTRRPFDEKGLVVATSIQGRYSDFTESFDPRGSFLISNTFDDKFGFLFSASYDDYELREDFAEVISWQRGTFSLPDGSTDTFELPLIPRVGNFVTNRERIGLAGALQFRPSDDVEFVLEGMFAEFEDAFQRRALGALIAANPPGTVIATAPQLDPNGGIGGLSRVIGGQFDNVPIISENRFDTTADDLSTLNFTANWNVSDDLNVEFKLGHSSAGQDFDRFQANFDYIDSVVLGQSSYEGVGVTTFVPQNSNVATLDDYTFDPVQIRSAFIDDKELSGQIDFDLFYDALFFYEIEFGVRFSNRDFDRTAFRDAFAGDLDISTFAFLTENELFDGGGPNGIPSRWITTSPEAFFNVQNFVPVNFEPSLRPTETFGIEEDTFSFYLQGNIDTVVGGLTLKGDVGLRYAKTDIASTALSVVNGNIETTTLKGDYSNLLPSINLALDLTDELILRFAASKAMARPTFSDLSPAVSNLLPASLTARQGNPGLEPFEVNQTDLGLEWYFNDESVLAATIFYKDVASFITTDVVDRVLTFSQPLVDALGNNTSGQVWQVTTPVNAGEGAEIKGIELNYQTPLDFLPIRGFGIQANFTYADSEITTNWNGVDLNFPFRYSPKTSYNLVGYYEDEKKSIRLAYAWQDDFLRDVRNGSRASTLHYDRGQLDLAATYKLNENVDITLDVFNLTDEVEGRYSATVDRAVGVYQQGRQLFLGAKMRF